MTHDLQDAGTSRQGLQYECRFDALRDLRSWIGNAESEGWYKCIHYWDRHNIRTGSPAGHLLYEFSKPLNSLELDPTYLKNPNTLSNYIRKWRMEQGLLIKDFAKRIGVTEDTVINWEIRGMVPRIRSVRERLSWEVEGVGRFLATKEG